MSKKFFSKYKRVISIVLTLFVLFQPVVPVFSLVDFTNAQNIEENNLEESNTSEQVITENEEDVEENIVEENIVEENLIEEENEILEEETIQPIEQNIIEETIIEEEEIIQDNNETNDSEIIEEVENAPVWTVSNDGKSVTSTNRVKTNFPYTFPTNQNVVLTFTELPTESGYLTIKEISLTPDQIIETGSLSSTVYEFTSTMQNGTFRYNLTLPAPSNRNVDVVYAEEVESIGEGLENVDNNIVVLDSKITIEGLDHFTVFILVDENTIELFDPQPTEPSVCVDGERFVTSVVSASQGLQRNGLAVAANRSDSNEALNAPDGLNGSNQAIIGNFYSLGFDGSLTVMFDTFIYDSAGDDLYIYDVTNNPQSYPEEFAEIYVSQNGSDWFLLSEQASSRNSDGGIQGATALDFSESGFAYIQYVRVVDNSNPDPFPSNADGFDVDAIGGNCGNFIEGTVYNDTDNDGDITEVEPGLENWTIELRDNTDTVIATDITDSNGDYYFANIPSGTYTVCQILQPDYLRTFPTVNECHTIVITGTTDTFLNFDFGNHFQRNDVTICKQDTQGNGLPGWTVGLSTLVSTVNVPANGSNSVAINVNDGDDYLLVAEGLYNYGDSNMIADAGFSYRPAYIAQGNDTWVSGNDLVNGWEGYLEIKVNGNDVNWGDFQPSHQYTLLDTAVGTTYTFNILDNAYGDNETDLVNPLRVSVYEINENLTSTTDSNGCAVFENVLYGDYYAFEVMQDGYEFSDFIGETTTTPEGLANFVTVNGAEEYTFVNEELIIAPEVTVCKEIDGELVNGWNVSLGEIVDTVTVNSQNVNGNNSINLPEGNYVLRATGVWTGVSDLSNPNAYIDAEYTGDSSWNAYTDGYPGAFAWSWENFGDLMVNNTFVNWGEYNASHTYSYNVGYFAGGVMNFSVFDGTNDGNKVAGWYGDNNGSITVEVISIQEGVTGFEGQPAGCFVFENVNNGDYVVSEDMQEGYEVEGFEINDVLTGEISTSVDVTVSNDEDVTFTFVNDQLPAEVTVCKEDINGNPLAGWNMTISSVEEILNTTIDSADYQGIVTPVLENGTEYIVQVSGTWTNRNGTEPRDAFFSAGGANEGSLDPNDGGAIYDDRVIKLVGDNFPTTNEEYLTYVGGYNPANIYSGTFQGIGSSVNIRLWDYPVGADTSVNHPWYNDNNGELSIVIYEVTESITQTTDQSGCTTFTDVDYGEYILSEELEEDWNFNDFIDNGVSVGGSISNTIIIDEEEEIFTFVNELATSTIQGAKVEDVNVNNTIEQNELDNNRLPNWEISLYDNNQTFITNTTTDINGEFMFDGLNAGTYYVCETMENGWFQTVPNAGTVINGTYCITVVLDQNVTVTNINFANGEFGTISGTKFSDTDADGDITDNEPTISDWTINIYQNEVLIDSVETDSNGNYIFEELEPGTYTVCEEQNPEWLQTYPGDEECYIVVIDESGEESTDNDFGNTQYGFIQGRKFEDFDADGRNRENGEQWINGWNITIFDSSWNYIDEMETGDDTTEAGNVGNGQYRFVNLIAGTYYVCEENDTAWTQMRPLVGQNYLGGDATGVDNLSENTNGGIQIGADICYSVTITSGQERTGVRFGNFELGSIQGTKYNDTDADGNVNDGDEEPIIEGWLIFIDENDNQEWDLNEEFNLTDENGNYELNGLLPGTYIVCEQQIDGWLKTYPSDFDCYEISIETSGEIEGNYDFGNTELGFIQGRKFDDVDGNGVIDPNNPDTRENGWTIYLFDSNWNQMDNMLTGNDNSNTNPTHTSGNVANGQYRFTNLTVGTYYVCEEDRDGWTQTRPLVGQNYLGGDAQGVENLSENQNAGNQLGADICFQVDLEEGQERTGVRFANFENATITVNKEVLGVNDESFDDSFDETEDLSEEIFDVVISENEQNVDSGVISDDGVDNLQAVFEVGPSQDGYYVEELVNPEFNQLGCYIEGSEESEVQLPQIFTVESGEEINITCYNQLRNPEVVVYKVVSEDLVDYEQGVGGLLAPAGSWEFDITDDLDNYEGTITNYDGSTQSVYDRTGSYDTSVTLEPGTYSIDEVGQVGYDLSWGRCLDATDAVPNNDSFLIDIDSEAGDQFLFGPDADLANTRAFGTTLDIEPEVVLDYGQIVYCVFYNVEDLEEESLMTVFKTNETLDNDKNIVEDKQPGDEVQFTIEIQSNDDLENVELVDLLPDSINFDTTGEFIITINGVENNAINPTGYNSPGFWNIGNLFDGDTVIISYIAQVLGDTQPGLYSDIAYATADGDVIAQTLDSDDDSVNDIFTGSRVNIVTVADSSGTVLGASTVALPSTGANGKFIVASLVTLISGITLILLGLFFSKKNLNTKVFIIPMFLIVGFAGSLLFTNRAEAATGDLIVKIENPAETNVVDNEIDFVTLVLDQAEVPTAVCEIQRPSGGAYITMVDNYTDTAGGTAGACITDGTILTEQGVYTIQVTVQDSDDTEIVTTTLDFDSIAPSALTNYSKSRNVCTYTLSYTNPNNEALDIQILRSQSTTFTSGNTTLLQTTIAANSNGNYVDNIAGCNNNEYYYILRTVDTAGNNSSYVQDSVVVVTPAVLAPINNPNQVGNNVGNNAVLGENTTNNNGTDSDTDSDSSSEDENGDVLGEDDENNSENVGDSNSSDDDSNDSNNDEEGNDDEEDSNILPIVGGVILALAILGLAGYLITKRRNAAK